MTPPTTVAVVADVLETSSDEEDEVYSVSEGLADWYFGKSQATVKAYQERVKNFRNYLVKTFNRDIGKSLKKKHIRSYLNHKAKTCAIRPILCVIKSLCKHFTKRRIMPKDVSLGFQLGKQNACRTERNLKTSDIRKMFKIAQERKNPVTHAILQCLTFSGIRIKALSLLRREDVLKIVVENHDAPSIDHYYLRISRAKGNKHRKVALKSGIGKSLYSYAASLSGVWLFPSNRKGFEGKPMVAQSISHRIKRLAVAIKMPMISCHWFRHHYATSSLAHGGSLVDVSKSMGHSNVAITSLYLHSQKSNVSNLIDLSFSDEDLSLEHKKSKSKSI